MKKFLISLSIVSTLALTACETPLSNTTISSPTPMPTTSSGTLTDTNTTITSRFSTKAEFINWLTCLKNQVDIDAQMKSQFDLYLSAINLVPDMAWTQLAQQYASTLDSYASKYDTVCR